MVEKSIAISTVCSALRNNSPEQASIVLKRDYPFPGGAPTKRRYGPRAAIRVFVRDGFVDRYTGERLVFMPVLRVLSIVVPTDFPLHPYWRMDATHPAFWEVGATIDHVIPVTRGGPDAEPNWVTTSMARNSAKGNWTLEQLGWTLRDGGKFDEWDGLMRWFVEFTESTPTALKGNLREWRKVAVDILSGR